MKTHYVGKKSKDGKKKYIIPTDISSTLSKQDQTQREKQFQKYKRYYSSQLTPPHAWQYISNKFNTTSFNHCESIKKFDFNGRNKKHFYAPISFLSKCSRFGKVNLQPQTSHTRVGIHLVNCLLYQPFRQPIQWNQNQSRSILQAKPHLDKCTQVNLESLHDSSEDQPMVVYKDGLMSSLKLVQNVTNKISSNISRLVAAIHYLCDSLKGYNCMLFKMLDQQMKHENREHSSVTESLSDKIFLTALGYRHARLSSEDSILVKPLKRKSLVLMLNDYIDKNCSNKQGQICIDKSLQEKIHAVDSVSNNGFILNSCADKDWSLCSSQVKRSNYSHESVSLRENQDDDLVQNTPDNSEFSHLVQYNTNAVTKELLQQFHQKIQTKTILNDLSFYRVVKDFYDIALQCCKDSELRQELQQPSNLIDGSIHPPYGFSKEPSEINYEAFSTLVPEASRKTVEDLCIITDEPSDEDTVFSSNQSDGIDSSIHQTALSFENAMLHRVNGFHGYDAMTTTTETHRPSLKESQSSPPVILSPNKRVGDFGVAGNSISDTMFVDSTDIPRGPNEAFNNASLVNKKGKVDRFFVPKVQKLKKGYLNNIPSGLLKELPSNFGQASINDEFNTERVKSQSSIVLQGSGNNESTSSESSKINGTYSSDSNEGQRDTRNIPQQNNWSAKMTSDSHAHDFAKWVDTQQTDLRKYEDLQDMSITLNFPDTNIDLNELSTHFGKSTSTQNRKSTSQDSSKKKQFYDINYDLPDEATTYFLSEDDDKERTVLNDEAQNKMLAVSKGISRRSSHTAQEVDTTPDTITITQRNALAMESFGTHNEAREIIPIVQEIKARPKLLAIPTGEAGQKDAVVISKKVMQTASIVPQGTVGSITSVIEESHVPRITVIGIHEEGNTQLGVQDNTNQQSGFSEKEHEEFKTSYVVPEEGAGTIMQGFKDNHVWETTGAVTDNEAFKKKEDFQNMKTQQIKPVVANDEAIETRKDFKESKVYETQSVVSDDETIKTKKKFKEIKARENKPVIAADKAFETRKNSKEIKTSGTKHVVAAGKAFETKEDFKELKTRETKPIVSEKKPLKINLGTEEVTAWETTGGDPAEDISEKKSAVKQVEACNVRQNEHEDEPFETRHGGKDEALVLTQLDAEDKVSEIKRGIKKNKAWEITRESNVSENCEAKGKENHRRAFHQEAEIIEMPALFDAEAYYKNEEDDEVGNAYYEGMFDLLPWAARNEETLWNKEKKSKDLPLFSKGVKNAVQDIHGKQITVNALRDHDSHKSKKETRRNGADGQGEKEIVLKNEHVKQHEHMMKNDTGLHAKEKKQNNVPRLNQDVSKKNSQILLKRGERFYDKENCGLDSLDENEEGRYEPGQSKEKANSFGSFGKPHPFHRVSKEMSSESKGIKNIAFNEDQKGFSNQKKFTSSHSYDKKRDEWSFRKNDSNESDKIQEKRKLMLSNERRNMNRMMQMYRCGIRKELLRAVRAQNLKGMKKCILEMENLLQQAETRLIHQEEELILERDQKMALQKMLKEGATQDEKLQEQLTKMMALLHMKEKDRILCLGKLNELNSYVCDMEKQYHISLMELQEAHEKDKKKLQSSIKQVEDLTTYQEMYKKENRILKNKIIKYESQMSCGDIILSQRAALLHELTTRMERKLAYIEVLETQKNAYQKLVSSLNNTFSKTSHWPKEAQMIKDTLQKVQDQNYNSLCEKLEQTLCQLHQKTTNSLPEN